MESYDPMNAPDPDEWQSLDEDERISLVLEQHREAGVELPSEVSHAAIHVVVENQIALGDEMPTQAALERLISEGLHRHDAIHAVGGVLVNFMHDILGGGDTAQDANERFCEEVKKLKASDWLKGFR